jgi:translocator protein
MSWHDKGDFSGDFHMPTLPSSKRIIELFVIFLIVAAASGIGSRATIPNIPVWYEGLAKPSFNPPNWIFGPVWTALYLLMTYSAWRVLGHEMTKKLKAAAIVIFLIQLTLNMLWSVVFFGLHDPASAFIIVIGMEIAIIAMILIFARIDPLAAALQIPYAFWVAFASILNLMVMLLNPVSGA